MKKTEVPQSPKRRSNLDPDNPDAITFFNYRERFPERFPASLPATATDQKQRSELNGKKSRKTTDLSASPVGHR
jgi:hypothetical protein